MLQIQFDTEIALHLSQLLLCCSRERPRELIRPRVSYIE